MKDPYWAYEYATRIIKGRWEEAESVIMKDPDVWDDYTNHFDIAN
jgi:hypothetical protein